MRKMIKLSQRLQAIADFVPQGARVADVGTDHGFLPCYLAQNNHAVKVYAYDINEQPLALAQKNVADYNVGEIVSTRLGNGLAVIEPGEVDVVTIAGMGGSLMIEILDAAPLVVDKLNRIILQPNVGAEAVRIWAEKNRWHIVEEQLVRENDRFSVIIAMEPGRSLNAMTPVELFLGPELLKQQHPLLGLYISEEYDKAQMVLVQLAKSDSEESRHKEQMLKRKWEDVNGVIKCRLGVSLS
jgi:tRNA (adenine22-N1)-methyltransferase